MKKDIRRIRVFFFRRKEKDKALWEHSIKVINFPLLKVKNCTVLLE